MRKVMLLAAVLAMVLAAAAPVFAQTVEATGGDDAVATNVQYVDCSQVVDLVTGQYGDAEAVADDGSVAEAANQLGISVTQVNQCLGGEITVVSSPAPSPQPPTEVSPAPEPPSSPAAEESVKELPETGGASLLALGAGALLVAGGLVARRIVR